MTPKEKRIDKLINRFYGKTLFFEDLPLTVQKTVDSKGESAWMDAQRLLNDNFNQSLT
tara:strand:- start:43 stop:216 length:174 start_codon:yes stop_codon:yes gene_type:complete